MGDLQIFHAVAPAQPGPAPELFKAEGIYPGVAAHVHKLHGQPFAVYGGVQRRREHGREQHIDAVLLPRRADEILQDAPVLFAQRRNAVIRGQAVRMEPLGVQQRLGGQPRPAHAQRKAAGERKPGRVCVPVEHAVGHPLLLHGPRRHGHLIRAGGRVRGDVPAQPHAAVLARQRRNRGRLQRGQQVREQARLLRDVVLVRAFVAGIIGGHQLHGAQNGGRGRAVRLDGKALHGHARRGVVRTVYELHRGAGAPPDGKARAVRKRRGALCREYLLQRRRKEKFISGHKTNSFYDLSVFRSLSKKLRFCAKLPANRACGPVRRARRPSAVASLCTPRH